MSCDQLRPPFNYLLTLPQFALSYSLSILTLPFYLSDCLQLCVILW